MDTKVIIANMLKLLETSGWTQGIEKDAQGRFCLLGAFREVVPLTNTDHTGVNVNEGCPACKEVDERFAKQFAVEKSLGLKSFISYNDQDGRTWDEVKNLLQGAL